MKQQEFYQKIAKLVEELLGKNYHVVVSQVQKIGYGQLDVLFIKEEEQLMMPVIYLQDYYVRWEQGEEIELLAEDIVVEYLQAYQQQERVEGHLDFLHQKEQVERNLFFRCVPTKQELLPLPHREVLNLSIVYSILLNQQEDAATFITITEKLKEEYGWTEEQLFQLSMKNTSRLFPEQIYPMEEILYSVIPYKKQSLRNSGIEITIVSNTSNFYGFSVIFYPEILARLAEKKGGNLLIIPSSIHEALIFRDWNMFSANEINKMILEINHKEVSKEDRLSNCAYYYDKEKKALYVMEDYRKGEQSVCVKF